MEQTQTTSGAGSLDPQAVSLAKAIRQTESGGDFKAKGKSGEYGAYQFTEPTWNTYSKKYGISSRLQDATPEQQNQVAYSKIKEWKDKGYNPGQIASMWNAGEGEPEAYTGKFSTGKPSRGVNSYGVNYDVPAYAKSVATAYQTLKQGGNVGVDPANPSSIASTQNENVVQQPTPEEPKKDLLQKVGGVVNKIFPGEQVGKAIGTLAGYIASPNKEQYDLSAPTPLQVGADVAQGALMVGTGMPESSAGIGVFGKTIPTLKAASTVAGRIGQNALIGSGFGLTNALKEGKTDVKDIAKDTATGGTIGGVLGGVGEGISKVAEFLPKRLARSFIPGINDDTTKYAVEKGLGSPATMLKDSETSINKLSAQLGEVLKSEKYANIHVDGKAILNQVAESFKDSGMKPADIAATLKRVVPLKSNLVNKLMKGDITLKELHTLNSALGKNTFKTVFDDPAVKAGKEVGANIYHQISKFIKTEAPETVTLFDDLSKELPLRKALEQVIRRGDKGRMFTLRDLVAIMTGAGFAGLPGAAVGFLGEKALTSPTVNLKVGGVLSNLAKPGVQQATKAVRAPLLNTLTQ